MEAGTLEQQRAMEANGRLQLLNLNACGNALTTEGYGGKRHAATLEQQTEGYGGKRQAATMEQQRAMEANGRLQLLNLNACGNALTTEANGRLIEAATNH